MSAAKKTTTGSFIGDFFLTLMGKAEIPDDELKQKWVELNHTYLVLMDIVKLEQCNIAVLIYEYKPVKYLRIVLRKTETNPSKTLVAIVNHLTMQAMLFKIEEDIIIKEGAISQDEILEIIGSDGFQDITEQAFPHMLH